MDKDMKEMVRHTLHPGDKDNCYEPKLTRAKVRYVLIPRSLDCHDYILYGDYKPRCIFSYVIAVYFVFYL